MTAPSPAGEDSVELDDLPPSPYDHLIAGSEDSTVQEELLDEAGAEPDRDTGSDEMPPQEGSPETLPAHEFTPRKETDQQEIDDANYSNGSGRVDTVSDQEVLPDKTDTRGTTSQHQEASKSNDDATLADDRTDPLAKEWTEHLVEVREGLDSARRDGLISKRLHTIDGAGRSGLKNANSFTIPSSKISKRRQQTFLLTLKQSWPEDWEERVRQRF